MGEDKMRLMKKALGPVAFGLTLLAGVSVVSVMAVKPAQAGMGCFNFIEMSSKSSSVIRYNVTYNCLPALKVRLTWKGSKNTSCMYFRKGSNRITSRKKLSGWSRPGPKLPYLTGEVTDC